MPECGLAPTIPESLDGFRVEPMGYGVLPDALSASLNMRRTMAARSSITEKPKRSGFIESHAGSLSVIGLPSAAAATFFRPHASRTRLAFMRAALEVAWLGLVPLFAELGKAFAVGSVSGEPRRGVSLLAGQFLSLI